MILGATGLVGSDVLNRLLVEEVYKNVISLNRRTLNIQNERLTQHIVDMSRIEYLDIDLKGGDAFCCIGTTIKRAGSESQFKRIEYDYAMAYAKLAKKSGARHFLLVSAAGASLDAKTFHLRVKGKLEKDIEALGFECVTILKPNFLLGQRSEFRLKDSFGGFILKRIAGALVGPFEKFKAVDSSAVGWRMVNEAAYRKEPGTIVLDSYSIETH